MNTQSDWDEALAELETFGGRAVHMEIEDDASGAVLAWSRDIATVSIWRETDEDEMVSLAVGVDTGITLYGWAHNWASHVHGRCEFKQGNTVVRITLGG